MYRHKVLKYTFHLERRSHGSLRLADGGSKRYGGQLQYFFVSQWITLCYNGWTITDAQVACRQMGFNYVVSLYKTTRTVAFSVSLGELSCSGSEQSLQYCPGRIISLCFDSEHVGIICSSECMCCRRMYMLCSELPIFYKLYELMCSSYSPFHLNVTALH